MNKATQKQLLNQEAAQAITMCMEMFNNYVLESETVQSNSKLAERACNISDEMYGLYNIIWESLDD